MLKQLHELRGLIAVDLVARVNVRESINRERDWSDSNGIGEQAMEKLSGCFSTWQNAQESVLKTAQLMKIDLETVRVGGVPLTEMVGQFAGQLRQIRGALENRDFVLLNDILTYEATETTARWQSAVAALRGIVGGLQ